MFKFLNLKDSLKISNFKLKIPLVLVFLAVSFLQLTSPAYGQTLSLSLWPPLLEVMMQPGRTITQVYKLTNNSDHPLQITPQIFPFEPQGEFGQVKINFSPPSSQLVPIFSFASREKIGEPFLINIGETKELVLKISLPQNTPEKDFYYILLFSTGEEPLLPITKTESGQTSSIALVGTNILLTSSQSDNPPLLGKIANFSVSPIIDSFSAVNFTVLLENQGKTFWKPFGQIEISGPFNQKTQIRLKEQNVLANSTRQLAIDPLQPRWPIGPFKARLSFTLNENGPQLTSEINFWYFPYKLIGAILVLVLIFLLSRWLKKCFLKFLALDKFSSNSF